MNSAELIRIITDLQSKNNSLESDLKFHKEKINELFERLSQSQIKIEELQQTNDMKLGNSFNINSTWIDKIVFVLKSTGRPMRSSEIIEVLLKYDKTFRTLTDPQKGLSAHITKALKYGRILGTKVKGMNGYTFTLQK
jgi:hypothetical protein